MQVRAQSESGRVRICQLSCLCGRVSLRLDDDNKMAAGDVVKKGECTMFIVNSNGVGSPMALLIIGKHHGNLEFLKP